MSKIALARYGMIFRGSKVMIAQEKGAVGVIIYSDPADDGYSRGKWRMAVGVSHHTYCLLLQRRGVSKRTMETSNRSSTRFHSISLYLPRVSLKHVQHAFFFAHSPASIVLRDPRRVDKCLPKDSKKQMVGGLIPSIPVQPISYGYHIALFVHPLSTHE